MTQRKYGAGERRRLPADESVQRGGLGGVLAGDVDLEYEPAAVKPAARPAQQTLL